MNNRRIKERREKERRGFYAEPKRSEKRTGIDRRIYIINRRVYNSKSL